MADTKMFVKAIDTPKGVVLDWLHWTRESEMTEQTSLKNRIARLELLASTRKINADQAAFIASLKARLAALSK